MSYHVLETERYGENDKQWQHLAKKIRKRDDYTCLRCGIKSGPHANGDGRVLQVHHKIFRSRGGTDDPQNLATLCRPCHGVQHPTNEAFDDCRDEAALYPVESAPQGVAYVNTGKEKVTPESFLSRFTKTWGIPHLFGTSCNRCSNRVANDELVIYPRDKDADYVGDTCKPVCRPCASLLLANDDRDVELRTPKNERVSPEDLAGLEDRAAPVEGLEPKPDRELVNKKERLMFESPLRHLSYLWNFSSYILVALFLYGFYEQILPWSRTLAVQTTGEAEQLTIAAALWGILVGVSVAASAVRWGGTAITGYVLRFVDSSIEPHHFKTDVFWRWLGATQHWIALYSLPLIFGASFVWYLILELLE